MRTASWLILVVACGSNAEPDPEPIEVASGGDETQPATVEAQSFGGDASSWMAAIRDTAVLVMMGGEPPTDMPIEGTPGDAPWVQMRDGDAPTEVEALTAFFEGAVTLSDGNKAEVVVLFTPAGPRLARIDGLPPRDEPQPPLDPFLEPIAELARAMLADFRLGQGAQHIVTVDELRDLLDRPDLVSRVQTQLPDTEDIAAIEAVIQQPGVQLAHIRADKIGVLMRDPNGTLYGVDLRFRAQDDGTYRFAGPPLLRVQRLDEP